jgi:hypothetical protein
VFYSCSGAKRDALPAKLSLLIGCDISEDVLESSDFAEVGECVWDGLFAGE